MPSKSYFLFPKKTNRYAIFQMVVVMEHILDTHQKPCEPILSMHSNLCAIYFAGRLVHDVGRPTKTYFMI